MKDTPPEVNARLFAAMMRKTPEERFLMGLDMMATVRELVREGLRQESAIQSPETLAHLTFQRLHGVPLPW